MITVFNKTLDSLDLFSKKVLLRDAKGVLHIGVYCPWCVLSDGGTVLVLGKEVFLS